MTSGPVHWTVHSVKKTQLFVKIVYNMKIFAYIWAAIAAMALLAVICGAWWHLFSLGVSLLMCWVCNEDESEQENERKY